MERIAHVIVHHRKRVLALTGMVSLLSALMLFRMDFNADVASFVLEGNETGETFAALQDKYDSPDPINVVVSLVPEGETFLDIDNLVALAELRDTFATMDGIGAVTTVVPEVNPITGGPLTTEMLSLAPPEIVRGGLESSPLRPLLLSEDGRHALVFLAPTGDAIATARLVDDVTPPSGLELTFSGNPVVFATVIDLLSLFLLLIPPVVIGLLVAVFYATIGDRRLSVLALIPAALGALWTFGLIFGLGREIDIVTVIVPVFVIVMGSADGLHFVSHFQDSEAVEPVARVEGALSEVGVPMILTTISTAAGFLSLVATDVHPIRQLGLFTAVGITFAGIISFFSLPAVLSGLDIEARHHDALLGPRVTRALRRLVRTRRPAAVLAGGLIVFAALTLPRLDVNPDQLFFFKGDDPVRVAFERTEELFGGATPLIGEFVYDADGGPEQLERIAAVSAAFEDEPGVREVFSVADVAGALPPEQLGAVLSGDVVLPVGDLVSDDGLRFLLLPSGFATEDLRGWLDFVDETPEIRVLTGMPVVWDEIARLVLRAQLVSLLVAFALVTLMLFASYRRIRQTLVSLVPIALTVATMLGFIALSGIQLNLLTAVISGIVIGVGIDYAIHFVAAIDHSRRDGPGYVLRAIDRAGRPIVANALGIAVALTALWLSPLAIHPQVSMIMWVAMLTGAATALIIIPALLPREGVEGS